MSKIYITGIGIISPLGETIGQNLSALRSGVCGITEGNFIKSRYSKLLPFGEVKLSNQMLKEKLGAHEPGVTRTSLLAFHAFSEAVKDADLSDETIRSTTTAFVGADTVGGLCLTDEMYRDANLLSEDSPFLASYDYASVNMYIQARFRLHGLVNTINTACSSSANAIMFGARLIKNGLANKAIVGGCDSLAKYAVNGFNSLNILSNEICRPFDEERKGLNLGEGAAFLVLEKEKDIGTRKVYAELSGWCNTNDAFHPSSLSEGGEGPYLAMDGALRSARLQAGQIDFINAHGTGTENNDAAESRAMLRLFEKVPAFASTKSNTGHTLGACGAIESVYSILSLYHQEIHPALNFRNPIPSTGLIPVQKYEKRKVHHVLSNSFGFGGNCTSLVFSRF